MKLDQYVEQLTEVELSQYITGDTSNYQEAKYFPRMINLINMGLSNLHQLFLLKKGYMTLTQEEGVSIYTLVPESPYLEIETEPMNFIEVISVNEVESGRASIHNPNHVRKTPVTSIKNASYLSFYLRSHHEITFNTTDGVYQIMYRRNATPIQDPRRTINFNARNIEVDIPDMYLEALNCYVAERAVAPITNITNTSRIELTPAYQFRQRYERAIQLLISTTNDVDGTGHYSDRFANSTLP